MGFLVAFPPIMTPATRLSEPDEWSTAGSGYPISWPLDSDAGAISHSGPSTQGTELSANVS